MPEFHNLLAALHGEIWEGGTGARPELDTMLAELGATELPQGVARLPSSSMHAGPHLAAQDEASRAMRGVTRLEALRAARSHDRHVATT
ncbi:MAG: hypothetical protein AAF646_01120 [Pseudomonadota bacterium]